MTDEWGGLAVLLANMIEKYAADIDIDNMPNLSKKKEEVPEERVEIETNAIESPVVKNKAA